MRKFTKHPRSSVTASKADKMTFDEYCQATWGIPASNLTADDKKKAEEEYHNVTKKSVQTAADATHKTDRRLSPTSVRYRGYLIVLDRGGDGYNIYDKHRELEDAGHSSLESAKKCVDDIIREENGGIKAAEETDTYWMAKYTDINGNQHKILFKFNSSDFSEAEEEMDAVIPEPYTRARLLGRGGLGAERDGFVLVGCDNITVTASEDVDEYEDDIREISQEFTSENTSINSGKLPAIFKMIHLEPGTINIDYGGGKFDNVAEYLAPMDVVNLVYDPYNRTPEHNREVLRTIRKAGGADSATCSNVLNVIKEPEVRRNVLENIRRVVKPEGVVYITVYEGSGRGDEGPTKSGYQLNRKTADYLNEIKEVFPDAIRKGKLIIAHPNGSAVNGSSEWFARGSSAQVTSATSVNAKFDVTAMSKKIRAKEDVAYGHCSDFFGPDDFDDDMFNKLQDMGFIPDVSEDDPLIVVPKGTVLKYVGTDRPYLLYQVDGTDLILCFEQGDFELLFDDDYEVVESATQPNSLRSRIYEYLDGCGGYTDYNQKVEDAETIMSASSISMKAIHDKLLNAASKRMQKSDMGFPLSEIAEYLIVDEEETEDGALRIEVRCELDYEGMEKLAEVLDPIVARYDKDAYFDMVAPGIMEAFIFNKKVTADTMTPVESSVFDFPEPQLEPPDYADPEEKESVEYITVDLDDDIIVEVDTVDFAGSPKFEKDEADWVVDEYPSIQLDYSEFVAENVLDLLVPQLPAEPGIYRVRGRIHLAYDVMVPVYYDSYGPDDEEYTVDDDNVEIDFNYKKSSIENLEVGKD